MPVEKLIPLKCNTDLAAQYFQKEFARYIKNLSSSIGATNEYDGIEEGQNEGVLKPLQANEIYTVVNLPEGDNYTIGAKGFPEVNEVYVWVWNSKNNHCIYRLNGDTRTAEIVKIDPCFNFKLRPENFIHESGAELWVIHLVNPETNEDIIKKDLYWTDGDNYQGYIRTDDCIETNGYDPVLFPYFSGTYDRCAIFRMGNPTLNKCIKITEVARTAADDGMNNNLLFNGFQFRIKGTNVFGQPTEHDIISEPYFAQINDCFSSSNKLPRCLNLTFDAGTPLTDTVDVEFRYGNETQWYSASTLFLYKGSNIGKWWLRQRNPNISYDPVNNTITYRFCRTEECNIIDPTETDRVENPMPFQSKVILRLNKVLSLVNNKSGFNKFQTDLLNSMKITVVPPTPSTVGSRTITVLVPIYNNTENYFSAVAKDGVNGFTYGGYGGYNNPYQQHFKNTQQSGFGGYLVGTGGFVISTQVKKDENGQLVDDPEHTSPTQAGSTVQSFQKFVFTNVPPGVYVFRLFSNLTDPVTDSNYTNTSTTVWGLCPFNNTALTVDGVARTFIQELVINVCAGDYSSLDDDKVLTILDISGNGSEKTTVGYIHETQVNGFLQYPVELMSVTCANGFVSMITDHNGFYYFGTQGSGRTYVFDASYKCGDLKFTQGEGDVGITFVNVTLDEVNNFSFADYFTTPCNRILVKGRIVLSGRNIGIPNVTVVLTRGSTAITDDDGFFTIIAHDEMIGSAAVVRNDSVIITNGVCTYTAVGGGCIGPISVSINPCTGCTQREVAVADTLMEYETIKSLLSDGTYGICCFGYDWLGRRTNAEPIGYANIPSIVQSQTIGPSLVSVTIPPSALFDPRIEYITFGITAETTIADYLSWIVDRFYLVDDTGNINNEAPTQIKIYYASIIEYNKQHNYNTTTAWQFIPGGQNTPATGDKVYFYLNGDGVFFTKTIIGLVKYDQSGQYFLIDYTSDLKGLKQNALIRLVRSKICTGNEPYFEICDSRIDIKNRKAVKNIIVLNAYDTYYLSRQIPVPTPLNNTPQTTTITTTNTSGSTVTTVQSVTEAATTVNEARIFSFRFEHHSVSNFWGYKIWNRGRVGTKNPFEAVMNSINQVAITGSLSINGQLNYLAYFDEKLKIDFDIPDWKGISFAFMSLGKVHFGCQYGNFLVGYNDDIARINSQGQVIVPSGENVFGNPEETQGHYGCQHSDKNTARYRDGLVFFVDKSRSEFVRYAGGSVKSLTKDKTQIIDGVDKGKCDAWFRLKCKQVQADHNRYFISWIDPVTDKIVLSDFSLTLKSYINTERYYNAKVPEAVSFDILSGDLRLWHSFTPEYGASLDGDILSNQMFTFKNSVPYAHYNVNKNNLFNTFYGVKCGRVFRIIGNSDPFKKKKYLVLSVYCKQSKYFSDKIVTETGQRSRMLLNNFEWAEYFSFAPFLCDTGTLNDSGEPNTQSLLFEGNSLYGSYIEISLIGDPLMDDKYSELFGCTIEYFNSEKSG